jgi:hypothetical protein
LSFGEELDAPLTSAPLRRATPVGGLTERVPDSSVVPHRSHDSYHGSYNDYLWQLGLADGAAQPDIVGPEPKPAAVESDDQEQ